MWGFRYDEVLSLWARMPSTQGGLSFSTSDLGLVFSIGGLSLFIYQLFLYAPIERALGPLRAFRWGLYVSVPVFLVLPHASMIADSDAWRTVPWRGWSIWVWVVTCQCLRTCGGLQAFTSSFIMTANVRLYLSSFLYNDSLTSAFHVY
jgi:hypothetical protein